MAAAVGHGKRGTKRADYRTGVVQIWLINVDRFDRVALAFHSNSIDEPMLEDLVRLILGRSSTFLLRAPLVGIHGQQPE
ncbi:MAG: hypothetical protein ABI349_06050 [Casimicrobiaceae bacterium]